jgi:hypothetical protein
MINNIVLYIPNFIEPVKVTNDLQGNSGLSLIDNGRRNSGVPDRQEGTWLSQKNGYTDCEANEKRQSR